MHHKLDWTQECKSCKGTGLYVGMAEKDGAAVVCHGCKGTGESKHTIEYDDFTGLKIKETVIRVYETNAGIGIGAGDGFTLKEFGGMCYEDWLKGHKFPPKSEMRKYTCPAWWYQSVDYDKKPDWCECFGSFFKDCRLFKDKDKCWDKWDEKYL